MELQLVQTAKFVDTLHFTKLLTEAVICAFVWQTRGNS